MFRRRPYQIGLDFEEKCFGFSDMSSLYSYKYPFKESIRRVMEIPLTTLIEDGDLEYYDPFNPSDRWGMSSKLLRVVRANLPRRVKGKRIPPVALYLAGGTGLDMHWKVDAFFYWNDHFVTVDASTGYKSKDPEDIKIGVRELKADLLLSPADVKDQKSLGAFGLKVAEIFRSRDRIKRSKQSKSNSTVNRVARKKMRAQMSRNHHESSLDN